VACCNLPRAWLPAARCVAAIVRRVTVAC
jgi:hypothetical protein